VLNNFARAIGEGLREKVDLAMTSEILKMRFAHYLGDFADDEGFLQATYQAGLQVERMKMLEKVRQVAKPAGPTRAEEKKKEERKREAKPRKIASHRDVTTPGTEKRDEYGIQGTWGSYQTAMEGVPGPEWTEYISQKGCHRCGRP